MKKTFALFLTLLLLSGCAETFEKAEVCKGSVVRGCIPTVYFDFDSSELNADAEKALKDWTMTKMNRWPTREMKIVGHADLRGSEAYNKKLALARANRVREYMIDQGLDARRITVESVGKDDPATQNMAHQDLNRYVEIRMYFPRRWGIF